MAQQYQAYQPENMAYQQQDPAYQQQDPTNQQQYEAYQQQQDMTQQPQEMAYQGQTMTYEAPATSSDGDPSTEKPLSTTQQWANGFWSCCSPFTLCFKTCCCACLTFGKTQARNSGDQDPSSCNGMCMGWTLLSCFGAQWVLQGYKRLTYRKTHGIDGDPVMDFAGAFCCPCCGLMQEEKESLLREGGGVGMDEKNRNMMMEQEQGQGMAYQQNQEMAYQQDQQQQMNGQNPEVAYQQQDQQNPQMAYQQQNPQMAYQ